MGRVFRFNFLKFKFCTSETQCYAGRGFDVFAGGVGHGPKRAGMKEWEKLPRSDVDNTPGRLRVKPAARYTGAFFYQNTYALDFQYYPCT
jgi:hypothetical protein